MIIVKLEIGMFKVKSQMFYKVSTIGFLESLKGNSDAEISVNGICLV